MPPLPSEEDLLQLLRGNPRQRERGFRLLVRTYGERLYAHVHRLAENHADTDDILQNTFVKVHRHLDGFGGQSKLYTWLYRIATNEALSFLKKRNRRRSRSTDLPDSPLPELRADSSFDAESAQTLLLRAIGTLPEKQRLVFSLRYFDELPYQAIADIVDTSVGGLKASYHHAAKKVEAYLKNQPVFGR